MKFSFLKQAGLYLGFSKIICVPKLNKAFIQKKLVIHQTRAVFTESKKLLQLTVHNRLIKYYLTYGFEEQQAHMKNNLQINLVYAQTEKKHG